MDSFGVERKHDTLLYTPKNKNGCRNPASCDTSDLAVMSLQRTEPQQLPYFYNQVNRSGLLMQSSCDNPWPWFALMDDFFSYEPNLNLIQVNQG